MKHIIKTFTVEMPAKMAKTIRKAFDAEQAQLTEPPYMLMFQPISMTGECRVHIISQKLGTKMQKLIDQHKTLRHE